MKSGKLFKNNGNIYEGDFLKDKIEGDGKKINKIRKPNYLNI